MPALVFLIGASMLWGTGWKQGRAACDQYEYHLPAISKFATELPGPDLSNYLSATTPGYHLVMAVVERATGAGPVALQIAASVFTLALLVMFGLAIARAGGERGVGVVQLIALALPVALSPYVFTSGVWLLPDNAGWLLVLLTLLIALWHPLTVGWMVVCAVLLALTVLVRQSHLWVAAPVVAAAWLASTPNVDDSLAGAFTRPRRRLGKTALALAACVPAVAILYAFYRLWGGLTTPRFQVQHGTGINWATPAFIFSLVAIFSVFFVGWLWTTVVGLWRTAPAVLVLAAVGGLVAGVLPETTFFREPRSGGLWSIVGQLDQMGIVIAGRTSPLIVFLSTLGAPLLVAWIAMVNDKSRWIYAAALAAFIGAQSANANCWQRYHEPLLLMVMALIAAAYAPKPEGDEQRSSVLPALRVLGPLGLAGLLAIITLASVLTGRTPAITP